MLKSKTETEGYAHHYGVLQQTAERLRAGGPDDVDTLVESYQEAMRSYEICRTRLNKIRAELDAEVSRDESATSTGEMPLF